MAAPLKEPQVHVGRRWTPLPQPRLLSTGLHLASPPQVGFLREFAGAEEFVGNVTGAAMLREMATNMAAAVNAKLWAAPGVGRGGDDHYITQLNPDNTTRDFVDYDSNLIAVAHNIPDDDRALRVCLVVLGSCAV